MEGFFSKKETQSTSRPDGKVYSCASCGLLHKCKSPKIKPQGNFKKGIMNIGEFPLEKDDRKGTPWQSKSGQLLQLTYDRLGIDLFEDCINLYAVGCYSSKKAGPSLYEIACCRKNVLKQIEKYKPKIIVCFGKLALESLIGFRWKKKIQSINGWRGLLIPDQEYKAWVCPVFNPEDVIEEDKEVGTIWRQDLERIVSKVGGPFLKYKEPKIEEIEDLSVLDKIQDGYIAFDYETTGIKPHAKGHRIVCVSVATSANHVYVFMMPLSKKEREPFIRLLINPNVGKIAQNMKYEHTWSMVKLKTIVVNWIWDTMLATHILDNRDGITGLKFQTYAKFGIIDYSSEISPYFKSVEVKNGNAINIIDKLIAKPNGKWKLLQYCGYDSIYEYRLAEMQMEIINPKPF